MTTPTPYSLRVKINHKVEKIWFVAPSKSQRHMGGTWPDAQACESVDEMCENHESSHRAENVVFGAILRELFCTTSHIGSSWFGGSG